MELTERFVVPAPVDRVWQLFDDVPEVVGCMPGAEVTERVDDRTYNARLAMAVGPIRPKFDVRATIERDDSTREGRIDVHAVDKRGGSQARAQIVYKLVQDAEGTAVELTQNVALSGPLAQFGRTGVIEDINAQMTRQFAECLAEKLAAPASPEDSGPPAAAAAPDSENAPAAPAERAPSNEIRIVPLLARTVLARILKALRLRR
ncbi:MAG TPA: SRPBCC family protein [Gaiellaceae bacterium]|nr:SRPBCC family protein [Gaiellaceae bacterium]